MKAFESDFGPIGARLYCGADWPASECRGSDAGRIRCSPHQNNLSSTTTGLAGAMGGALEGSPRQVRIFCIASGGCIAHRTLIFEPHPILLARGDFYPLHGSSGSVCAPMGSCLFSNRPVGCHPVCSVREPGKTGKRNSLAPLRYEDGTESDVSGVRISRIPIQSLRAY